MSQYSTYRLGDISRKLDHARFYPLDVMVTGVTGAGKSSTLNALFLREIARVGRGCEPETMGIDHYRMNERIRLWDTPGLGDGIAADLRHQKAMIDLLTRTYTHQDGVFGLIDLALVVIDGSGRDLGATYSLINDTLLPYLAADRVMVVINQADIAMKGRHWDDERRKPLPALREFLDDKALSIQKRVREATGLSIRKPIYYSAEYHYNIPAFFDFIIEHIPTKRRNLDICSQRIASGFRR
ncbi:GTPase family protein [Chitinilyticum piscinae]|uniref:50S ribosome-binding GTPase n=1 Tax=Chitinilyticum piscinae TaxID=2866724 RepID=A0A8J7G2I7_9NEIS|nr:GTPase [Chitinilyticum piscinae]MBE9610820.1 50S ribosome-binding GTPase [Chitinilyticum piscinae]